MNTNVLKNYLIKLDKDDIKMIDKKVAEKGIEKYLNQQLIYLDCSRVINGMRMMQTIGVPYRYEMSKFIYAVEGYSIHKHIWEEKLIELHKNNIEYEKENPPIQYDDKPKKPVKRKSKVKEGDIFLEKTKTAKMINANIKINTISTKALNNFKFINIDKFD